MYATIPAHNSKNVAVVPQQRRPFCSQCPPICEEAYQCYADYVYTGLQPPEFCFDYLRACHECERRCITEPLEP